MARNRGEAGTRDGKEGVRLGAQQGGGGHEGRERGRKDRGTDGVLAAPSLRKDSTYK